MTSSRTGKTASKNTAAEQRIVTNFIKTFSSQIARDDVPGWWKNSDLELAAKSLCRFAQVRAADEVKVRVYNPDAAVVGRNVPHTIVEIVNDDMPFIVDSVSAALAAMGLQADVLFHPIVGVQRHQGKVADVAPNGNWAPGFVPESWIFIQLEQMLTTDAGKKLALALEDTLRDVRRATGDWKTMITRLDQVIESAGTFHKGATKDDADEAASFLNYIKANNFTFLGYREIVFGAKNPVKNALGVLKDSKIARFGMDAAAPEAVALKKHRWPVMVTKLVDEVSTVHRRVPMDSVAVRIQDAAGKMIGLHLFVGLFTSSTYSCRTSDVPVVRQKVKETVARCGFSKGSHDHKALEHILEKMPRDELFQVSTDELHGIAMGILRLQTKHRIALFTHLDHMGTHLSSLVYVPRDRYNTKFRLNAARVLENASSGKVTNYFTTLDDSPLARVLFNLRVDGAGMKHFDPAAAESKLVELGREWDERLKHVLIEVFGKIRGAELATVYGRAFPSSYHDNIDIRNAVHDIRILEKLAGSDEKICVDFYRLSDAEAGAYRLKVYHKSMPVPLSDILPELANMGLEAVSEMPYEVEPQGHDGALWIHDFVLKGAPDIDIDKVKDIFEDAFVHVWKDTAEDDGLNALVLRASLTWNEVNILRTYSGYMRQARFPYSRTYVEQVLGMYPQISRALIDLFMAMHDPNGSKKWNKQSEAIDTLLQGVQKLDHDRILRGFKMLIEKTLRTSYFQRDAAGNRRPHLALKLDSKNIDGLPLPKPHVEIFVYSPRVEAVHLRGGEIARGGIRWSDRHDDFRTEILGLMKSQQVKNTVIVPVGAKGGFVVKQPPKTGGREAFLQEGIECYKIFVQAMLDITDNNVKGKPVRPKDVVCHDGFDPYLVVAADKGTATFSDIANKLSVDFGFWLGDAFASGGSAGYDHKKMAITARGGWESVKRHFREMGKDIDKEAFTLVGVGDMAGDVFGNAMLLSPKMELLGAFNHVHIFCDPTPDIAKSLAERKRMFKDRCGWDQYDKSLISAGGGVFERSAKSIKLSPQIRKCFGIDQAEVTPDDLIKAILRADVELLWFGGIGTFVKSSKQSHADADDKSNDNLRIDATEIRAKVIGEGANLGTTQLSRIEFARCGGRINTDFIDNSAGVDCSDHEVNIKILLADVVAKGKLNLASRNKLLEKMTDDVAALVLRDNYQQTQSLSFQLHTARENLGLHADFVRGLEKAGLLKRTLEGLPDDEGFARLQREGMGLTRPELSILTSNAKIVIYNQILASDIPDDASMEGLLFDYFPKDLHKYAQEIKSHKLRREIIATQIVNTLVNRMGPVFAMSRVAKTGASVEDVIRAFLIIERAFSLTSLWAQVEALDNKVSSQVQLAAFYELFQTVKRAVTWFVRTGEKHDIAAAVERFGKGVADLKKSIPSVLPAQMQSDFANGVRQLTDWNVPKKLAEEIASAKMLSSACDIINVSGKTKTALNVAAETYFRVGEEMGLENLRSMLSRLAAENQWQARVKGSLTDDLFHQQAAVTALVLGGKAKAKTKTYSMLREKTAQVAAEMALQEKTTLEMIVLMTQRIGQVVNQNV